MFGFFKNKKVKDGSTKKTSLTLKIDGMHCSSCSMSVDGELEDLDGVLEAKTSYAKQKTNVIYDESKVDEAKIRKIIEDLGYKVS